MKYIVLAILSLFLLASTYSPAYMTTAYAKSAGKSAPVKELRLSQTNKVFLGVCGGLGQYFNIDPKIIRIGFVIAFIFYGSGLILYLILYFCMKYL